MGLFSNNKKLCPICGGPTPRLFPQKFDDQPICKECEKQIDLPKEVLNGMTLDGFRQYLEEYRGNGNLRQIFEPSFQHMSLILDEGNGLLRLSKKETSWVIEKKDLKSFRIYEDDNILFESGKGALISHPSGVAARAKALIPMVSAFLLERRAYERNEELERTRRRNETEEQRRERERIANVYRPRFEDPNLFWGFRIEVVFDHPYWTSFQNEQQGPTFDVDYPSVEDYLERYREQTEKLHLLATKLMAMIDPDAGEKQSGAAEAATASGKDPVEEIKQYKELLDQGVITEEEFAGKKKQLLGI